MTIDDAELQRSKKRLRIGKSVLLCVFGVFVLFVICFSYWWPTRRVLINEWNATAGAVGAKWEAYAGHWHFVNFISTDATQLLAADSDVSRLTLKGACYGDNYIPKLARCRQLQNVVLHGTDMTDESVAEFKRIGLPLASLDFNSCSGITDEVMSELGQIKTIQGVKFHRLDISGEQLDELTHLPRLYWIDITNCPRFDGENLRHFVGCKQLLNLTLEDVMVSDTHLHWLAKIPALKYVTFKGTSVTPEGIKKLKMAAPHLTIFFFDASSGEFKVH